MRSSFTRFGKYKLRNKKEFIRDLNDTLFVQNI